MTWGTSQDESMEKDKHGEEVKKYNWSQQLCGCLVAPHLFRINPYPTAFPYGNGMVLHFYQQQESSMTKTVHRVINKGLKAYV